MRPILSFGALCLALLPHPSLRAQANAGPDQEMCLDSTTMQANAPMPTDTAYWSLVSGSATITDLSDPFTSVTDIDYGENILAWTIITPMDTTTDQVSLVRYWVDPGAVDAGPDQTIYAPPFETSMNGSVPIFPTIYTWSIIQGQGIISDPNDPYTVVTDLGLGENILQWGYDDAPCVEAHYEQVVINVLLSTSVDGNVNTTGMWFDSSTEQLLIKGDLQVSTLSIMNAMGQCVADRSSISGRTINLSDLPAGSYLAVMRAGAEIRSLRFVASR
jgi:hypothetical protein